MDASSTLLPHELSLPLVYSPQQRVDNFHPASFGFFGFWPLGKMDVFSFAMFSFLIQPPGPHTGKTYVQSYFLIGIFCVLASKQKGPVTSHLPALTGVVLPANRWINFHPTSISNFLRPSGLQAMVGPCSLPATIFMDHARPYHNQRETYVPRDPVSLGH